MNTEKEKLYKVLTTIIFPKIDVDPNIIVTDYLYDNNCIIAPCRVGDTYYSEYFKDKFIVTAITQKENDAWFIEVTSHTYSGYKRVYHESDFKRLFKNRYKG